MGKTGCELQHGAALEDGRWKRGDGRGKMEKGRCAPKAHPPMAEKMGDGRWKKVEALRGGRIRRNRESIGSEEELLAEGGEMEHY